MTTDVIPAIAHNQFKVKFKRHIHLRKRAVDVGEENFYAISDVDPTGKVLHLIVGVTTAGSKDKVQGITLSAMREEVLNMNGYPNPDWP